MLLKHVIHELAMITWLNLLLLWICVSVTLSSASSVSITTADASIQLKNTKLLILALDGFRWDYYSRYKEHLPGFRRFLSEGLQAKYVEPIFPSLTYPSWTTLLTGLYPSHHNVIGNYMLHLPTEEHPEEEIFNLDDGNTTRLDMWWESVKPLWITATMNEKKAYVANFDCTIPYDGHILPAECDGIFRFRTANDKLKEQLETAVQRLAQGYSLGMIYDAGIDLAGHIYGPDSNNVIRALQNVDVLLQELLDDLKELELDGQVNVAIISDHGMTTLKEKDGVIYVRIEDYVENLDDIYKVIDYAAVVFVAPTKGKTDLVYAQLSRMPGVDVYKKEDIPEEFHYKEGRLVQDILLVARPGYFIVGLLGNKQIPNDVKANSVEPFSSSHGYYNLSDMRTIFFARGPAFPKGVMHPPIRLIDEYQIFTHLLGISSQEHNGTWENVKDMFIV